MNFYDCPQTLLEDSPYSASRSLQEKKAGRMSHGRRGWLFFRKPLAVALTVILLGLSTKVLAEPIKLGYAALSAGQIAAWMAKEGGYLSKYGIEAELIYTPTIAAK